jgi:hypothetical protein
MREGSLESTHQKVIKEDAPLTLPRIVLYRIRVPLIRYLQPQLKERNLRSPEENKKQSYQSVEASNGKIKQWGGRGISWPGAARSARWEGCLYFRRLRTWILEKGCVSADYVCTPET